MDIGVLAREVAISARLGTGSVCPPIAVTGGDGVIIHGDLDMLRAALLNVVMNGCQAAGRPVDIAIATEAGSCCIAVRDRGPGIPADARERVFEPFFTTRAGGTGLGLAIVKRLLDLHDGSIELKDRPDGGTIAEITLPLASVRRPSL